MRRIFFFNWNDRMANLRISCLVLLSCFIILEASAGAWPRGKGNIFLSVSHFTYTTTRYTTDDGKVLAYGNNGLFQSNTSVLYAEYGITPSQTVIVHLPLQSLEWTDSFNRIVSTGFGDINIGLRQNVLRSPVLFSFQGDIGIPSLYKRGREPSLGYGFFSSQISALMGSGYSLLGNHSWINVEFGYRKHFGSASDQFRFQILNGIRLHKRLFIIGQADGVLSHSNDPAGTGLNPNLIPGYDIVKMTISATADLTYSIQIHAGYYKEVWGTRSGLGDGIVAGVWIKMSHD